MFQQPWCLVVKAQSHGALPHVGYDEADRHAEIFGFKLAYFNPGNLALKPKIQKDTPLGFYAVCPEFPERPVCEVNRQAIEYLALYRGDPREVELLYLNTGLPAFAKLANRTHVITAPLMALGKAA